MRNLVNLIGDPRKRARHHLKCSAVQFVNASGTSEGTCSDGGKSWKAVEMGKALNKIRLLKTERGFAGYAIGVDLYKLNY